MPFLSQCENTIHARHLMLRRCSVSYINLPWVREKSCTGYNTFHIFISLFFLVVFLSFSLFLCIFWAVIVTEQIVSLFQVQVQALLCGQADGSGPPYRHWSGTMRFIWGKSLSMHSDSLIPHGEIKHSPGSELQYLTALSPASIFIIACFKSNPLKSAESQLCAQHLHGVWLLIFFILADILLLSPFLHHRPSPWTQE